MKSTTELYKGKRIFIARYDHMSVEELRAEVAEVKQELMKQSADYVPLVLVDTTGTIISPAVLDIYKEMASFGGNHHARTALLGITGARKKIMEIISKFSQTAPVPFDDIEQAKEWLVS